MDKTKKLFPQRLWKLIHDDKYNFCLRWSPDGERVYLNRNEFEAHYLKTPNNQFHTQKAISFVRQMNMYGFRKVDDCFYENDNFKRNCPHLLKNMVRRHSNKGLFSSTSSANGESNQPHQHQNQHQMDQSSVYQHQHQLLPHHNQNQNQNHNLNQNQSHYQNQRRQSLNETVLDSGRQNRRRDTAAAAGGQAMGSPNDQATLGAAMATMGPSTAAAAAAAAAAVAVAAAANRSPLASTLYHRLAALNFSQSMGADDQLQSTVLQHHHQQPPSDVLTPLLANQTNIAGKPIGLHQSLVSVAGEHVPMLRSTNSAPLRQQYSPQQPIDLEIPISQQQSAYVARQALQQTLMGSLLQLKHNPQSLPLNLQQNLLASLQQQNPNLFLESLVRFGTSNTVPNLANLVDPLTGTAVTSSATVSPIELAVVTQPPSSNSSHTTELTNHNGRFVIDNNSLLNLADCSNMTELNRSPIQNDDLNLDDDDNDDVPVEDEKEQLNDDNDDCTIHFGAGMLSRSYTRTANSSSSSLSNQDNSIRCSQNLDDINDAVLDLAKPSKSKY